MVAIRSNHTQLWVRRLDSLDAQPLAGTEGAANPFWSPDSRYIGFFADSKLKKVDVSGGIVSDLCHTGRFNMGGAWSSQGVILFSVFPDKLRRVAETTADGDPWVTPAEKSADSPESTRDAGASGLTLAISV